MAAAASDTEISGVTNASGSLCARDRLRYLATAVEPLRDQLGPERMQQLVEALTLCVGIESIVVARDMCNLDETEVEQLKQWAAHALLQPAIREAATDPKSG